MTGERAAGAAPRVLIGFAESLSAPEAAWSLLDAGFEVVAFTRRGASPPLRRERRVEIVEVASPETSREACTEDVLRAYRESGAGCLLPLDDVAVHALAAAPESPELRVAGPTGPLARFALDKRLQIEAAAAAGLAVPETSVAEGGGPVPATLRFPVVVKPALAVEERRGAVSKGGASFCTGAAAVARALASAGPGAPMLVQRFVEGVGEGVFGIRLADEIPVWSGHRRIRMMNPAGSGSSACRWLAPSPATTGAVGRMLAAAGWEGLFMVELLRDGAGDLWFMEMNGRSWGSMALARRAGFEYPAWAVRGRLDPGFRPAPPREGARDLVCRHVGREIVHLAFVLRGPGGDRPPGWPGRLATVRDLVCTPGPQSVYNWRRGSRRVFFDDLRQTVSRVVRRGKGGA